MTNNSSLVNLGEVSKPATVLIERIADAIGGFCKPWQIKRVAQAEADAKIILGKADIKLSELQSRSLNRLVQEETKKQINMENITAKALPNLNDNANPQNIEADWLTNFFDKCRIVSDEEMQFIWAKILAGEANIPGSYSKKIIGLLSTLEKKEAIDFRNLCNMGWNIRGLCPIVFNSEDEIYHNNGIRFTTLKELEAIGLLSFETLAGYLENKLPKAFQISYFDRTATFENKNENSEYHISIGKVILTKTGRELSTVCDVHPIPGFIDYCIDNWSKDGDWIVTKQ